MSGGLGNQLFQLCAGLYAALQCHGAKVCLDTRYLRSYEASRDFEIGFVVKHLLDVGIATSPSGFAGLASKLRLGRLLDTVCSGYACVGSIEGLKRLQGAHLSWAVLDGYFQHPDFVFPSLARENLFAKLSGEFDYLMNLVPLHRNEPRVGIHIRRGDYVNTQSASKRFLTIPLEHYRSAISRFSEETSFLVFGDDPVVTKEFSLEIGGIDVRDMNFTLQEEFMLLAQCDHYIISNSTFSWWASHLGRNERKRIVCPRNWFYDELQNSNNPLLEKWFEII
jgi:hypothetical protein